MKIRFWLPTQKAGEYVEASKDDIARREIKKESVKRILSAHLAGKERRMA